MAKKILIIEDEETLLELMRTQLMASGYKVEAAIDGEKGLALIASWKPDLILLDYLLPAKNGIEVLQTLKKKKSKIPVLVVSNSGNQAEVKEILKLGARDYLVKANFTPAEVIEKVNQIFDGNYVPQEHVNVRTDTPVPPEEPAEATAPEPLSEEPVDIVLIEDDRFLQDLLKKKLIGEGYSVLAAFDGEEGLRVVKERRPKAILLDILLPGIDGYEFLNLIKNDASLKRIPVIVLSNLGQREEVARAMALGAADFLIKANFAPDEILKKVKPVIDKAK
jgi:DNA-binding response OmpR family regulator